MSEEEIQKLRKTAQSYKEKIHSFILTTSPQIDGFKNSHRKYYEYVVTACGVFAGLTQALLVSNFLKIDALAVLGFIFFVVAMTIAFLGFKRDLVYGAKYTAALKNVQKTLGDFSYEIVKFSVNEITADDFKKKQDEFEKKYHDMRNNSDMEEANNYENLILKELSDNRFSNANLLTETFLAGIVLVGLSVLLPKLICFK